MIASPRAASIPFCTAAVLPAFDSKRIARIRWSTRATSAIIVGVRSVEPSSTTMASTRSMGSARTRLSASPSVASSLYAGIMTDSNVDPPTERKVGESCGMTDAADAAEGTTVDWREALPAAEFCCWVVVALAPMLRWINGAAVTDDQFYIQVALVTLALTGALSLRIWNGRRARRV